MEVALQRPYRLMARGGPGLSCDDDGVALGGVDLARVSRNADGVTRCEVRPPADIGQILRAAYGPQNDASVLRLHRGLRRAAGWLEAGDLASAGIEAVMLSLPDLTPEAMTKLAAMADLEKAGNAAWQTEPRLPAGQTGGGQWTAGGGTAAAKPTASKPRLGGRAKRPSRKPTPARSGQPGAGPRPRANIGPIKVLNAAMAVAHAGAVVPARTAAVARTRPGTASGFALPSWVGRLIGAASVPGMAALLDYLHDAAEQEQITNVMTRFGLDRNRPADVMAAKAYVWSKYSLPLLTEAPYSGPGLESASQAVMRFVIIHPDVFGSVLQGPAPNAQPALSSIVDAANRGLADAQAESRARPQGVAPELQANSRLGRAAISSQLQSGKMQAHHLVDSYNIGKYRDISEIAKKAGWVANSASNLIGLPADAKTQSSLLAIGIRLPIHNGSNNIYNYATSRLIDTEALKYEIPLSPIHARAILDDVGRMNRKMIMDGKYNPWIKVSR
jgi:hypothetical protein